jgi:uncharacterized membrane protein (DUF4010 family)
MAAEENDGVMDLAVVQKLAVSLGLGLLVGFQREWTAPHVAGLRTFALITVLGTVIALFAETVGGWLVVAGLLAVAAMLIVGYVVKFAGTEEPGLTTQSAALVMYMVGCAVGFDHTPLGILLAGGTAVLLHWKEPLHAFVKRIGEADIRAVIQLVLIALVILPVLPDKSYDPYGVVNPFEIWLMVVLIVGISLGGYVAQRLLGPKAGTLVSGILGGLISSTATTVSFAFRARRVPDISQVAAVVIAIASTVVFGRVFVEVAVVAPKVIGVIGPPLTAIMGLVALIACGLYFALPHKTDEAVVDESPADLKAAILFGLLYAAVLFAVAAVKERFGHQALYVVAALSGLTDMDAITLSTAQMINKQRLSAELGWRMILIGVLSNLAFKGAAVGLIGPPALRRLVLAAFGIALLGGALLLWAWP